jgi:hypothetical protein
VLEPESKIAIVRGSLAWAPFWGRIGETIIGASDRHMSTKF